MMATKEALCEKRQGNAEAPRRILFVCTGNTCRSPMAAALFNDFVKGEGAVASSAGLFAAEGAPISEGALQALFSAGIPATPENNYPAHRARTVSREMMEGADRVIAITASHALELTLRFPDQAAKIEAMPMDIADPYGGDSTVYLACLAALRCCMPLLGVPGQGEEC